MSLQLLHEFEAFLETIPLERYRDALLSVKTVEQDLPRPLNPLPAIYEMYWQPNRDAPQFPDFEDFFSKWWKSHLEPLDEFISKYFWGCSREFVRLGFKARLYRTLVSVLTQFHFAYAWKASCRMDLRASAELDMAGVDAIVQGTDGTQVALQVMKETYRPEARGEGRFVGRRGLQVDLVVEVAYTLSDPEELQRKRGELELLKLKVGMLCWPSWPETFSGVSLTASSSSR
ncbi:MAG: TaqI family restriction endonuclease [Anaerolineae bacterium]